MARRIRKNVCSVEGCDNKTIAVGYLSPDAPVGAERKHLCLKHYRARLRELDTERKLKYGKNVVDDEGKWEGCVECGETKVSARGMCRRCYARWYKKNRDKENAFRCLVDDCDDIVMAQSLCQRHYFQWWRKHRERNVCSVPYCGKLEYEGGLCNYHSRKKRREKETRKCSLEGCDKPLVTGGLCRTHYSNKWNWEKRNPTPWQVCLKEGCLRTAVVEGFCKGCNAEKQRCSVDGCDKRRLAKGLCRNHYMRQYNRRKKENENQSARL